LSQYGLRALQGPARRRPCRHGLSPAVAFGLTQPRRWSISPRSRPCPGVIEAIAPNDSEERFSGLGVQVIRARPASPGRGKSRRRSAHPGPALRRRHGVGPRRPPGPGTGRSAYLTNETVFDLDRLPDHLLVMAVARSAASWPRPSAGSARRSARRDGKLLPQGRSRAWRRATSCPDSHGVALYEVP